MIEFLASGMILGLAAGIAPGPLLALVIGETLTKGTPAGIRVAFAPLISDLPIVTATFLLLTGLTLTDPFLGVISLAGAAFLLHMSYDNWRTSGHPPKVPSKASHPLIRGVLTNILNPHPYLFWLTVGGSLLGKAIAAGPMMPVIFLLAFYLSLVGSKILLAMFIGRTQRLLNEQWMHRIFRALAILLLLLALDFALEGLERLGL